jgi:hypothetical protein
MPVVRSNEKETPMRKASLAKLVALSSAGLIGLGQAALADDDEACTKAPKGQWQTIEQLTSKLTEQGYKVKDIEFEDGCAEAEVEDKDGKKRELKLDPQTAALVKSEDGD